MIDSWKRSLLEGASGVFERCRKKVPDIDEEQVKELHAKIGKLAVANDFFVAKAQALGPEVRHSMIERDNRSLSIGKQCQLLSISRLSFCYQPKGETSMNLMLMCRIDKQYLETPFIGVKQMPRHLRNDGIWSMKGGSGV